MNNILKQILSGFFPLALGIWSCVSADVPHTFQSGTPALASEVNENFNSLDTRLSDIGKYTVDVDIDNFITPFSADGDLKNVVVLKTTYEDGSKVYWIRSFYENSSETISICGTPTVRPYIGSYPTIATDSANNVTQISGYTESSASPDFGGMSIINTEYSSYNTDGTNKLVLDDTAQLSSSCSGNSLRICVVTVTTCGTYRETYSTIKGRAIVQPFTLGSNGWDFDQAMVDDVLRDSFSWVLRIRAKGIGQIFGRHASGTERSVIYYRVNGNTRGSLSGTPFEEGQPLHGLFF